MRSQKRQRFFIIVVMLLAFGSLVAMWVLIQSIYPSAPKSPVTESSQAQQEVD